MKTPVLGFLALLTAFALATEPFLVLAQETEQTPPPVETAAETSEAETTPEESAEVTIEPLPTPEPRILATSTDVASEPPAPVETETAIEEAIEEPVLETIDPSTYIPGELIVKFNESALELDTRADRIESEVILDSYQLDTIERIEDQNVAVVETTTELSIEETIAALESNAAVEYAEPNYIRTVEALATTSDTYADLQWNLENSGQTIQSSIGTLDADIDAPEAWVTTKGAGVVVAVIDTGVDYNHPDLAGSMWDGTSCIAPVGVSNGGCTHGYDFAMNDKAPLPEGTTSQSEHGTHVAGIIAAGMNNGTGIIGVAPDAKIMALRVGTSSLSTSAILKAMDFAMANGADVINASYAGSVSSTAERDAIAAFTANGGIFVAAAANGAADTLGDDLDNIPETADPDDEPAYPAMYDLPGIISVTATDNQDALAPFANYGSQSVDLAAPGVSIVSAVPGAGYEYKRGTSMAAPHVTGAVALALAYRSDLSVASIKSAILSSGDAVSALSGKTVSGKRLNVRSLLDSIAPAGDTTAPTITLLGDNPMNITVGTAFTDPGAIADDNGATTTVMGTGTVDSSTIGTYTLTYTATDANNNTASVTRTVNVQAASSGGGGGGSGGGGDTTPPTIVLNGDNPLILTQGDVFDDPGVTVNDNSDPAPIVSVSGSVDVAILGSYELIYTATDRRGNSASTTRTVKVILPPDITPPSITLIGDPVMNLVVNASFIDPGAVVNDDGATTTIMGTGSLDTATVGSYTLTYTATDASNNTASVTRTVNVQAAVSSGSGGGGGGGGGGSKSKNKSKSKDKKKSEPTKKVAPKPAPDVPRYTQTPVPAGQVLGAAQHAFSIDLSQGATNADVTTLQNALKASGHFSGQATGYFGPLTASSLKAYQSANGVPATGMLDAATRAKLNATTTATATTPSDNSALITLLLTQLQILQAQLKALQGN